MGFFDELKDKAEELGTSQRRLSAPPRTKRKT